MLGRWPVSSASRTRVRMVRRMRDFFARPGARWLGSEQARLHVYATPRSPELDEAVCR